MSYCESKMPFHVDKVLW